LLAPAPTEQPTVLVHVLTTAVPPEETVPTVRVNVHVCPPMLIAKLAVPVLHGVPVIVYVNVPLPLAKVPRLKAAVKPVTPVEFTDCPLCGPALPPV